MAEIDPIVSEILLKGDDEFLNSLRKVGTEGAENIEKLVAASENGASAMQIFSQAIGPVEIAVSGVTAAMVAFIEQQTELTQKTILLAQAFGTTAGQLQEIETIFAESGVKVEQFERFANRLTVTIAREWPQIAESIKTYADENDAAQLRVQDAILRVQEAQNRLADNSDARSSQQVKDNLAVEQTYIKLQFAAQNAANEQIGALNSVRGAELSTLAAEERLATLQGRPPSAAEKASLELAQAQQAVDQARLAESNARIAQQEKQQEAALKQAQLEQQYDDLRRKAAQNARDDAQQRQKDENAVRQAIIARGEAEEKAAQFARTNIASIRDALDGIVQGNITAAKQIDITEVSVENLTKAIIAQAAEHSKATSPTGYETLRTIADLFGKDVDNLIDKQQRLAIVNKLSGTSMQALGVSAAEILNVLENDADHIKNLTDATDEFGKKVPPASIEKFRGSLADLNLQISILSQRFAAAVAPVFTAFLEALRDSIVENNGAIHEFISGLHAIGDVIVRVVQGINIFIDYLHLFDENVTKVDALKAVFIGIGTAITVATGPIGVLIVAIGLLITALGAVRDHWDQIKVAMQGVWDSVTNSPVFKFVEQFINNLKLILQYLGLIKAATPAGGAAPAASSGQVSEGGSIQSNAEGGHIKGPGTGTSDSILSRLSNGEFVVKAAAVANYGAGLFHALNNMELPGFAAGGLVPHASRLIGGTNGQQATSTLNLSLDGRSFNGFRGPKSVVDDLTSFAISRQSSSAGSKPSWMA